jgi:hypothetical protein
MKHGVGSVWVPYKLSMCREKLNSNHQKVKQEREEPFLHSPIACDLVASSRLWLLAGGQRLGQQQHGTKKSTPSVQI